MRNQRLRIGALAGIVALLGAGCSTHSIREGLWKLSFNAQDSLTRQPVPTELLPPTRVLVAVGWTDDGEEVTIAHPDSENLRMYGKIPQGKKEFYVRGAVDDYWVFQLKGNVMSPELVDGTSFAARHRFERNTGFEGRWRMQYVGEK